MRAPLLAVPNGSTAPIRPHMRITSLVLAATALTVTTLAVLYMSAPTRTETLGDSALSFKLHSPIKSAGVALNTTAKQDGDSPIDVDSICMNPKNAQASELARTYSSIWAGEPIGKGMHSMSSLQAPQGWSAQHNRAGEWMQLDLGTIKPVAGIVTQGRGSSHTGQYVTMFTIEHSADGIHYTQLPGKFDGGAKRKKNFFGSVITARYVKIVVEKWNQHITMRADALVCSPESCPEQTTKNVADHARSYSSCWDCQRYPKHTLSRLDSVQAWSAQHNRVGEHMTMDLGLVQEVAGVATQGRRDLDQFVRTYEVQVSTDGEHYTKLAGTFDSTQNGHERESIVKAWFHEPVAARFVRIVVLRWQNHISMRAAPIICAGAPIDCVSSYGAFGPCSATCGGGTHTKHLSISTHAAHGGAACPASSVSQSCNTNACPVDCVGDFG
eukprot:SAG11_NODE_5555_length_1526_cov_2.592151_1_plen_440_part_10